MTVNPQIAPRTEPERLVVDIGGTWVRCGLVADSADPHPRSVERSPVEAYSTVADALREYLDGQSVKVEKATLAVACPVVGDHVALTNSNWSFSRTALAQDLGLRSLDVVNDFAALAQSIPLLAESETRVLSPGCESSRADAPILVIGPGTGLGVSALLPVEGDWIAIEGEGGHRDLGATTDPEWQVLQILQREFGHVSAERVLSGDGLVNLYQAWQVLSGTSELAKSRLEVAEIVDGAHHGDRVCVDTTRMFSAWLGAVVGDAVLTFGALGGVYLGGGVLDKMGPAFDEIHFLHRFAQKGRFGSYLERVPVRLILDPVAGLRGAAMWSHRRKA